MLNKISFRGFSGFAVGVLIGQIVMIMISLGIGDGTYYSTTPQLLEITQSEIMAVILNNLLFGIVGCTFAVSSFIFEIERWSLLKQYVVHFIITATIWLTVSYIAWLSYSLIGLLSMGASFLVTYLIIWTAQYFAWRSKMKKINDRFKGENE